MIMFDSPRRFHLLFAVLLTLIGCGDSKPNYVVEQKVAGVTWPTPESFPRWRKIWDGESWIVALSRDHQNLKSRSELRSLLATSFARSLHQNDKSLRLESLVPEIATALDTRVFSIANLEKTLDSGEGPMTVFGFGMVRLKGGFSGLQNIFMLSKVWSAQLETRQTQEQRENFMLRWMWSSLEETPGVEFAEPDLESEVQQEPQTDATKLAERFKAQWNTSLLGLDVLAPSMLQGNTAVVAVVDTGVDNAFDLAGKELAGRLYRNPGEDPEKGAKPYADDDGNGWVDDYIGVNASIPKGEGDYGPPPIPGSNDVGGPGAACDQASGEGASACSHGTHVAGIIAGGSGENSEFIGVCPFNCKILPIRAAKRCIAPRNSSNIQNDLKCPAPGEAFSFDPNTQLEVDGGITDSAQLQALGYILDLTIPGRGSALATNVVNLSIGKYFSSRSLSLLSRRLTSNDVLMVAAAGNQNVEIPMFPAAYRDVVAVCATSHDPGDVLSSDTEPTGSSNRKLGSGPVRGRRLKSRYSNYGDWVDICAPGSNIKSIVPGGGTDFKSGTSQAAPHVAGVAALIKAIGPRLSALDVRGILLRYANFDLLYGKLPDGSFANGDFAYAPYPDVKVFLLGSGMLSAANSFYAITDPVKARELVSQADSAVSAGDTSQVTSGCVVSSIAAGHPMKMFEAWTSLPVVLMGSWFALIFIRRKKKRPACNQS